MNIIKFDLNELKKKDDGFSYYILGRSYDLEENGANQDFEKALIYYYKGCKLEYPLCIYSLGISYKLGLGDVLQVDEEKGEKLYMNKKEYKNLEKSLLELVDNGIISSDQFIKAKEYYGNKKDKKSIVTIFSSIGILLIALSIITLFAINWKSISKGIKIVVSFIPIVITSILLYIYMVKEDRKMRIYTSIFAPVGILATNSLLAQVFHIQSEIYELVFVSLIMFLPIAFILRNYISLIIYGVGTIIYSAIAMGYGSSENMELLKSCLLALPMVIFNVKNYLDDKKDGRNIVMWIINVILITLFISNKEIIREDVFLLYLYLIYLITKVLFNKENILNKIFSIGFTIYLIISCISPNMVSYVEDIEFGFDTLFITIAIAYLIYVSKIYKDYKECCLFLFVLCMQYLKTNEYLVFIFINIITVARGILSIVFGNIDNSHKEIKQGVWIILLIIAFRFFASDLSFTEKSILFLVAGTSFVVGAKLMKDRTGGGKEDEQIDNK